MFQRYGAEGGGFSDYFKEYLRTHQNDASVDDQSTGDSNLEEETKNEDEIRTKREFFLLQILKKRILGK